MDVAKRVTKNTFYAFSSQILNKLVNVVFIIFSARLLGAKAYGIFVLVSTMILISSSFTNFGIRPMIIRRISKNKEKAEELLSNILAIRFCLSLVVYSILVLFVSFAGYPQEVRLLVYIAGIAVVFNSMTDSFETIYISFERMRVWGTFLVLSSLTFTTLAIILLISGYRLKTLFIINVTVAATFALLSGNFILRNFFLFKPRLNFSVVKDIFISAIPFFCALMLMFLDTRIDIMMLSMIKAPIESNLAIGYYAPAHNILLTIMILPRSLNMAMLPIVSQKIYSEHDTVRKYIEKATKFVMIAISFPIIIATTFFSKELITLIFGSNYLPTAPALTILGWAYAFYALNIPTHSVLGSSKELKQYLPLIAGSFLLNIALNYLLIPKYSYIGASIGTLIVLSLGFVGRFYFLRKILQIRLSEILGYLKLFFLLGITLGSAYLIRSYVPWPILILLTIGIYLFLLYISRTFEKDEITLFINLLREKIKGFKQAKVQ